MTAGRLQESDNQPCDVDRAGHTKKKTKKGGRNVGEP
jgi:hypothetical protein